MNGHEIVRPKVLGVKVPYCKGCKAYVCEICRAPMNPAGHSCSVTTPRDERHV